MPRDIDPSSIRVGHGLAAADSVEAVSVVSTVNTNLDVHILDPVDAHDASAISIDGIPSDQYNSDDVEGALDELSALLPPRPATLGNQYTYVPNSGIPDWGVLKLNDGNVPTWTGGTTSPATLYPYYHAFPDWTEEDPPFSSFGVDPITDSTFNISDGVYTGGGRGVTHAGGHTRSTGNVVETARIVLDATTAQYAIVSGVVYPADRGVLALLYIPEPTTPAAPDSMGDFSALTPLQRCPAAILLGGGILSGSDGTNFGGLFTVGTGASPAFDYFAYPGAFTGQPSLHEINSGTANVFPGVAGGGTAPAAEPTAGQVRGGGGAVAIPVLGATTASTRGGNDNNFFAYRLPYLADYSSTTGLRRTPVDERARHFKRPTISAGVGDLTQAGDYTDFETDFWPYQVARFRHRFKYADASGSGADGNDHGTFVLVHFKTEQAFEDMVITTPAVAPSASDVYSVNLVSWTNVEDPDNITDGTTTSAAYHVLRAAIVEDTTQTVTAPVTKNAGTYTISRTVDRYTQVSGVKYFLAGGAGTPWCFETMSVDFSGVWEDGFRTADAGAGINAGMGMANPGFLYTGAFHSSTNLTNTIGFGTVADERVEFKYTELDKTSGPFSLTNGPLAANKADFDFTAAGTDLTPSGDLSNPKFSRNAIPRMFFRKPLANRDVDLANYTTNFGGTINITGGKAVLFHSAQSGGANVFINPATATTAAAATQTAAKDVEERFLDETYRYDSTFVGHPANTELDNLLGPGLPGPALAADVAVRPASGSADADWEDSSWVKVGNHVITIPANELQVAGWPDRNPKLTDAATKAIPSAGCLIYPQHNYTNAGGLYRPSTGDGDITVNQFDYSAETGDRVYVRAFDVKYSQSGTPEDVEGQPFVVFHFKGLSLTDFAYAAPGPGSVGIALMCKVPGLTSWMDIGRRDGDGPSKQDAVLDGAGCKVIGPDTFDTTDSDTGARACQVKVNVGPVANLFVNTYGEAPILVKVIIKDNATGKALNLEQGGANGTSANIIGLYGIKVLRLSDI